MNKRCIILAGPTAVGKTALAIELARHFNTAIISADSRQCFQELNIGVAKPSPGELAAVPHYFINSHSIKENVSAADFEKYALEKIGLIFQTKDVVIVAGGTGLYIKALCEGLDEVPAVPQSVRERIIKNFQQAGINWLQEELRKTDVLFSEQGEMQNPQRMMRALEVKLATGKSILEFQKFSPKEREFEITQIYLDLPRHLLYERINERVDSMIEAGLVEEVKGLVSWQHLNALQSVGYTEIFDYLNGKISLAQAIEDIKKNTRHYAKRQNTWFKKDQRFIVCPPYFSAVIAAIGRID